MALSLTKALLPYDRQDTAQVECGGGWIVEVKPYSSVIKELSRQQAKLRSSGVLKDKKKNGTTQSASLSSNPLASLFGGEDEEFLLGSYEADVKFFVHNSIVGWIGLVDDDGNDIPFSADVAIDIFVNYGEPGKRLYREVLACTLDTERFIKTTEQQAEEDTKN